MSIQVPITLGRVSSIPRDRAERDPLGPCITDGEGSMSNAEFSAAVEKLAARLSDLGVSSGDTVAVMLPNCLEIVATMFAAWSLGAALTPINPALTDDEVIYQLRDSASLVLVGDPGSVSLASHSNIKLVTRGEIRGATTQQAGHSARPPAMHEAGAADDDFALVIYTSGTTGRPKGCLLDHANLDAMSRSLIEHFSFGPDDTSLLILPLFHCNGLVASVISVLRAGGNVVVAPKFAARSFWDLVEEHRPTFFSAVPTIYALLEAKTERAVDTSSLRFVVCGAAPMPADLIGRFERRFGVPLVEGYGLSEGTVASTLNPVDGPRKAGTVGPPLPGQEVAVVSSDGQPRPQGERGEVVIRGANVMRGYLGLPEETESVVRDGWLHTGDVGYLDEDGYLVLVDRVKDMIIRGGENIFPKEIEDVLYRHHDVIEAAVVGRPDDILGEVPVAFVAPRPGKLLTEEELLAHCSRSLARYKVPQEIRVLSELPKNSVGKLVKGELRDMDVPDPRD